MSRRTRKVSLPSSSDNDSKDEELCTPSKIENQKNKSRSSVRLSSRKKFKMPDRSSVFDKITPSPSKAVEKFMPRKLVNNFTRVTHRYNYDRASSDDSENDDFIDDGPLDPVSVDEEASDDDKQREEDSTDSNESYKLKHSRHASRLESDSDGSGSDVEQAKFKHNTVIDSESDIEEDIKPTEGSPCIIPLPIKEELRDDNKEKGVQNTPEKHDSESEIIAPSTSSHKKMGKKLKRHAVESSSDSDSDSDRCSFQRKGRVEYISDIGSESDSESDEPERLYSSNEENEKLPSDRIQLMASRKMVRKQLFDEMAAKRRKKLQHMEDIQKKSPVNVEHGSDSSDTDANKENKA